VQKASALPAQAKRRRGEGEEGAGAKAPKAARVRKTKEQMAALKAAFAEDKLFPPERKRSLAQATQLAEKAVFDWFNTERSRDKKKSRTAAAEAAEDEGSEGDK